MSQKTESNFIFHEYGHNKGSGGFIQSLKGEGQEPCLDLLRWFGNNHALT